MKKLISALALLMALCLALGLSCADGVADARSYVNMMYKGIRKEPLKVSDGKT